MRLLAYGAASVVAVVLAGLFVRALPDAAQRAREGERRVREAPCEALAPSTSSPVLGELPAPAPDFALKDYAGRVVTLSSLRGSVVVVNFWATWCKPCVVEIPSMERLVEQMKDKPFRLLAVSVDDDWPTVRRFFAGGTPLTILLDPSKQTPGRYGTQKFPESFIIDRDGNVRYYVISDRDWSQPNVRACMESLLD